MKQSKAVVSRVEFEVDDYLVVADPCYVDTDDSSTPADVLRYLTENDHGVQNLGVALSGCAGRWTGEITIESETGGWGDRVSVLTLTRQGFHTGLYGTREEMVNYNGVDSGQMYAGCLSNLPLDYERMLRDAYAIDPSKEITTPGNYNGADCVAVCGGIVSSTGYGDGSYPVYVTRSASSGDVLAVEVRFLEEEDEDEYDED